MTINLKPNPTAEELEALQKRVDALKRKAYDECTEEVHKMCQKIYLRHLVEGKSKEDFHIILDGAHHLTVTENEWDAEAFIIGDVYNEVTQQAYPSELVYSNGGAWLLPLEQLYYEAVAWIKAHEWAQIGAQYGLLLEEIKRLGGDVPEPFTPDFEVGDEVRVGDLTGTIILMDCDSAEYTLDIVHYDWGGETHHAIKRHFWEVKKIEES